MILILILGIIFPNFAGKQLHSFIHSLIHSFIHSCIHSFIYLFKEMERDINISMFDIRIAEMKTAWTKNREELSSCLFELVEELTEFQDGIETEKTNEMEEKVLIKVEFILGHISTYYLLHFIDKLFVY